MGFYLCWVVPVSLPDAGRISAIGVLQGTHGHVITCGRWIVRGYGFGCKLGNSVTEWNQTESR